VLEDVGRDLPLLKTGFSEVRPMFALRSAVPDWKDLLDGLIARGIVPRPSEGEREKLTASIVELLTEQAGGWYSGEDISFFHRVKQAGHRLLVDTRPRLFHKGSYLYGIEDVQVGVPRARTLELDLIPLEGDTLRPGMVAAMAARFEGAGEGLKRRGGQREQFARMLDGPDGRGEPLSPQRALWVLQQLELSDAAAEQLSASGEAAQ
jgi:hypothetical protein